jgi:hypothetical protein
MRRIEQFVKYTGPALPRRCRIYKYQACIDMGVGETLLLVCEDDYHLNKRWAAIGISLRNRARTRKLAHRWSVRRVYPDGFPAVVITRFT